MLIYRFRLLASNLGDAGVRETLEEVSFARDSPLEGAGFELVWGFSCQVVVFGFLPVLCSELESRSSFFNRTAGGKRFFST